MNPALDPAVQRPSWFPAAESGKPRRVLSRTTMSQQFSHAPHPLPPPPPAPNLQDTTAAGNSEDDHLMDEPEFDEGSQESYFAILGTLANMHKCATSLASVRATADGATLRLFDKAIRDMYRVLDNTWRVFKGQEPYTYKDGTAPSLADMGEELNSLIKEVERARLYVPQHIHPTPAPAPVIPPLPTPSTATRNPPPPAPAPSAQAPPPPPPRAATASRAPRVAGVQSQPTRAHRALHPGPASNGLPFSYANAACPLW